MATLVQKFTLQHFLLCIIVIAVVLLRLPLLDVPLERDEGEYAYMGQLILQGIPPYQAAYNMKFPGIYFLYAVVMAIFGQTLVGIHIGLLVVNIISILLLYLLGKNIHDQSVGIIAAASYAILSLSYHVEGLWANAEHFILPFALAGLLLLRKTHDNNKLGTLFLSGLAFGLATLTKQHGVFYALCGLSWLVYQLLKNNTFQEQKLLKVVLVFIIGICLPLLIALMYLYYVGVFDKFFFWAFTYAPKYVSQHTKAQELFRNNFLPLVKSTPLLWVLAGAGFLTACFSSRFKKERFFLVLFALFAFLATTPGFFFRLHYFLLFLPAVSIFIGIGFSFLVSMFSHLQNKNARLLIPAAFTIIVLLSPLASHADVLFKFSKEQVSRATYGGNPFPEALPLAQFVKEQTTSDDKIAIIGSEPEILFYAQRRSATGYIYLYPLLEKQPYAARMEQEMRTEVEAASPKLLLYTHIQHDWYQKPEAELALNQWFFLLVNSHYTLIARLEYTPGSEQFVFLTDKELLSKEPTRDYWISVFRRKQ